MVPMSKEELKKAHQELSLYRYNINSLKLKNRRIGEIS